MCIDHLSTLVFFVGIGVILSSFFFLYRFVAGILFLIPPPLLSFFMASAVSISYLPFFLAVLPWHVNSCDFIR